jgi:hypothetical protein
LPLWGGAANKVGNRYERLWTVLALLDVLAGDAEYIRIEYPGDAGRGAEFLLLRDGIREWHQVKRQHVRGSWSIADLDRAGVLVPWWPKLANGDRCVFVSAISAQPLAELVDHALAAESWTEFDMEFLGHGNHRANFERLRLAWGNPPDEAVFRALRQVGLETIGEKQLHARALDRAARLVDGDPAAVARQLAEVADNSLHHRVTAPDIRRLLGNEKQVRIRPAGDEARDRYVPGTRETFPHSFDPNVDVTGGHGVQVGTGNVQHNSYLLQFGRQWSASRRMKLLIVIAAALAVIAAVAGYLVTSSSSLAEYFQTGPGVGINVPPPTANCNNVTPDVLISPRDNVFTYVSEMHELALDGRSAFLMQGTNGDMTYEWLVSDPNGAYGGMQLQWQAQGGSLHSCSVTLSNASPAALAQQGIRQLSTLAVPTVMNGEPVSIRACVWYTVRKDDIPSQCWS